MKNLDDVLREFQEENRAAKEAEQKRLQKEKDAELTYELMVMDLQEKLKGVFNSLENEIRTKQRVYELEQFKDYKNLAHQMIMEIVDKLYSENVLKSFAYSNMEF